MTFTARDFIGASQAAFLLGGPLDAFQGLSIDTRTLQEGDLFFAIPGPHHDGHDHLEDAARKGAAGCVIQSLDQRVNFERSRPPANPGIAPALEARGRASAAHLRGAMR